ncbi:hypothetical protein CAOG_002286, partial [Capsaspora owczarzaki ATCC 30864]
MNSLVNDVRKHRELIPLVVIVTGAVSYGIGSIIHTTLKKDVVVDHVNNPFPWQSVDPNEFKP